MGLSNAARLCDQVKIDYFIDANGTIDGTADMIDMKDYDGCLIIVSSGTTTIDATNYVAHAWVISNTTAAGAGTDHIIAEAVTTDGGTTDTLTGADMYGAATAAATSVSDKLIALDVKADQMYPGDRYICLSSTGAGTFVTHVMYIRYRGAHNFKDMFQGTRTAFQYDGDLT